jgi:non-ribosomal peptide synthetase component E (peptide arylation enzyme)
VSRHQRVLLSYDRLDRDSNALARGLVDCGVAKGDRCAVSLGNGVEFATVCEFNSYLLSLDSSAGRLSQSQWRLELSVYAF